MNRQSRAPLTSHNEAGGTLCSLDFERPFHIPPRTHAGQGRAAIASALMWLLIKVTPRSDRRWLELMRFARWFVNTDY